MYFVLNTCGNKNVVFILINKYKMSCAYICLVSHLSKWKQRFLYYLLVRMMNPKL